MYAYESPNYINQFGYFISEYSDNIGFRHIRDIKWTPLEWLFDVWEYHTDLSDCGPNYRVMVF